MSHCPDPETLATFLEGGLSCGERQAVEAHAADCDRCYFTVRETQSFRAEQRASPGDRMLVLARAAMAAAVLLAVLVSASWLARTPTDPRETLATALRDTPFAYRARATLGRVSLDVPWAPWQGVERTAVDPLRNPDAWPIWEAIGPSQRQAGTETEALALQGLAHLVLGQGEQAAESLENARAIGETDADTLSDLAAAYLQISVETRDPDAPHRALRWASRALALDPGHPGALFNRALALETQGLAGEATKAWSRYLEVDGTSPWAEEARERLEALEAKAVEREGSETPPTAGPEELSEWGRRLPQAAREHLQRVVMPAWGARYLAGDGRHESSLHEAAILADVITRRQRDPSFAAMVADTQRRAAEHPTSSRLEARGHVAFGEGWAQLVTDPEESARQLALATDLWKQAESSWAPWGRIWMLHALYFMGERTPADVRQEAESLLETLDASEVPLLRGRVAWKRGTLASFDQRYDLAIASLREAFRIFDAAQEADHASFVAFLVADNYLHFGDTTSAWEWIGRSLSLATSEGGSPRYGRTLIGIGSLAQQSGEPEAALAFLDEGLAFEHGAGTRIDGLRYRAKLLDELGRTTEARQDLRRSRELLDRLETGPVRDRFAAEVLLDEAEIVMAQDSRRGRVLARSARERWRDRGIDQRILRLHVLDAEGSALSGELARAQTSLDAAEGLLHQSRSSGSTRLELPGRTRRVFELLLDAHWKRDRDPVATLRIAEQARRFGDARVESPAPETRPGESLPAGVVALYFEVLPDHTLAWLLRRDRIEVFDIQVSRRDLRRLALEADLSSRGSIRPGGSKGLTEALREPLESALRGPTHEIVVVPDEFLFEAPFPALALDDGTLPLGLDAVVSMSFDLGFMAPRREFRPIPGRKETLVIADPELNVDLFPRLPGLPHARKEAGAILQLDQTAVVLQGAAANITSFRNLAAGRRLIHLATHALPNPRRPWRSLLPLASSQGEPPLYASDIAELSLGGTELVVLSSCGSGRSGEGVGGLARGFLDAGAQSVIAARWPVRDRATAELLEEFYRRFFAGETPAEALQGAQKAYRLRHRDDPEDYTWAAFQLFRAS